MAASASIEEEFNKFKETFKRNYATPEEEQKRFEIFKAKYEQVQEHNKKYEAGEADFKLGINQFSDLTQQESRRRGRGRRPIDEDGNLISSS